MGGAWGGHAPHFRLPSGWTWHRQAALSSSPGCRAPPRHALLLRHFRGSPGGLTWGGCPELSGVGSRCSSAGHVPTPARGLFPPFQGRRAANGPRRPGKGPALPATAFQGAVVTAARTGVGLTEGGVGQEDEWGHEGQ